MGQSPGIFDQEILMRQWLWGIQQQEVSQHPWDPWHLLRASPAIYSAQKRISREND
jgi:hypothetical protein